MVRIIRYIPVNVMLIPNIAEEPDFILRHEHGDTQCVYWCVSEPLVVEATATIQPIEVLLVCLSAEEVQVTNFEIGEELTVVVVATVARIQEPVEVGLGVDQLWVGVDKRACPRPERRKGPGVVEYVHVETILHVIVPHEAEHVVVNVAEEMNLFTIVITLSPRE